MALWDTGPRLPNDSGRYIPQAIRDRVMERDNSTCRFCGRPATDCDHVYPWSQGGTHHETNLVASCEHCNSIAGSRVFSEFAKKKSYILTRRLALYSEV